MKKSKKELLELVNNCRSNGSIFVIRDAMTAIVEACMPDDPTVSELQPSAAGDGDSAGVLDQQRLSLYAPDAAPEVIPETPPESAAVFFNPPEQVEPTAVLEVIPDPLP